MRRIFGLKFLRSRAVRWPLAVLLAGLAVHSVTIQSVADHPGGFAVPAILFLFALFLVLLPLLPIADAWDDHD